MKNITVSILTAVLSSGIFIPGGPEKLYSAGETVFDFLKLPDNPEISASAGAFSSISENTLCLRTNPAGLGQSKGQELYLGRLFWIENISAQNLSYVRPLSRKFTSGVAVSYLGKSGIQAYDISGAPAGKADFSDMLISGVMGYGIKENLSCGVSFDYIRENIAGEMLTGFGMNFGSQYEKIFPGGTGLKFGLAVRNPGFSATGYHLPSGLDFGAGYELFDGDLKTGLGISSDLNKFPEKHYAALGLEYLFKEFLFLRAGLKSSAPGPALSLGFGIGKEELLFDYAWTDIQGFGYVHQLGLVFRFGKGFKQEQEKLKLKKHHLAAKRLIRNRDYISAKKVLEDILILEPVYEPALVTAGELLEKGVKIELPASPVPEAAGEYRKEDVPEEEAGKKDFTGYLLAPEAVSLPAIPPPETGASARLGFVTEKIRDREETLFALLVSEQIIPGSLVYAVRDGKLIAVLKIENLLEENPEKKEYFYESSVYMRLPEIEPAEDDAVFRVSGEKAAP